MLSRAAAAHAETYPSRTIRIVVPLPPGANGDLMPRILAQLCPAKLGVSVVIENRPGAAKTSAPSWSTAPSPTATRCSPRRRARW